VPVCGEIFDQALGERPNQVDVLREDVEVAAADLLAVDRTPGDRTEAGLRANIRIGIAYVASWLAGTGAAAINNLMEDAATAEISRSQVWQWIYNAATLDTGETVTRELVERLLEEEYDALRDQVGAEAFDSGHYAEARRIFADCALADEYPDFLTLPAYASLLTAEPA
jgi:malate synthase